MRRALREGAKGALGGALLRGLAALLVAGLLTGAAAAGEPRYVTGIEDLPLMEGLEEAPAGALVFDAPEGRVVEALARGVAAAGAVAAFYRHTLPALGWRPVGRLSFVREDERLDIEITPKGKTVIVRFHLAPAPP